jgi:uncharacterized protein YaiL (DUF2058 family)
MSLRDQLLKAGLVSKKNIDKLEAASKKKLHDAQKNTQIKDKLDEARQ